MGTHGSEADAAVASLRAVLGPLGVADGDLVSLVDYLVSSRCCPPGGAKLEKRVGKLVPELDARVVIDAVASTGMFPWIAACATGRCPSDRDASVGLMGLMEARWRTAPESRINVGLATARQRSYELYGDEKIRCGRGGSSQPAADFELIDLPRAEHGEVFRTCSEDGAVVLIENADPFVSLAHCLAEDGGSMIVGERVAALVYLGGLAEGGVGRVDAILKRNGLPRGDVRYWGGIDRAGMAELYRYQTTNRTPIAPFSTMYSLCLAKQRKYARYGIHPTPASRGQALLEREADVLDDFPRCIRLEIARIVVQNLRVPQEVLAICDYTAAVSVAASSL